MNPPELSSNRAWKLPPLILHPFTDASGPEKLMESSRAHLILQGILPPDETSAEELEVRLLEGRLYEIRMLFYLGKDLERWVQQCVEIAARDQNMRQLDASEASFYAMLVDAPPRQVQEKLQVWGVIDSKAIFARAIGLRAIFEEPPGRDVVSAEFIKNYYRYADRMFTAKIEATPFASLSAWQFHFDLYASGEYTRILERQWEATE